MGQKHLPVLTGDCINEGSFISKRMAVLPGGKKKSGLNIKRGGKKAGFHCNSCFVEQAMNYVTLNGL